MRLLPAGDNALLVELASLDEVLGYYAALAADPPAEVVDIVPAARTVLVTLTSDNGVPERRALQRLTLALRAVVPVAGGGSWRRPAGDPRVYDGEDLQDVAELLGCDIAEVIRRHTDEEWTVAFCGFAPGFGYLTGTGDWDIPRRKSPRTKVPTGAVGAGRRIQRRLPPRVPRRLAAARPDRPQDLRPGPRPGRALPPRPPHPLRRRGPRMISSSRNGAVGNDPGCRARRPGRARRTGGPGPAIRLSTNWRTGSSATTPERPPSRSPSAVSCCTPRPTSSSPSRVHRAPAYRSMHLPYYAPARCSGSGHPGAGCGRTSPYAAASTCRRSSAPARPTCCPASAQHPCSPARRLALGQDARPDAWRRPGPRRGSSRRRSRRPGDSRAAPRLVHRRQLAVADRPAVHRQQQQQPRRRTARRRALWNAPATANSPAKAWPSAPSRSRRPASRSSSSPTTRSPAATRSSATSAAADLDLCAPNSAQGQPPVSEHKARRERIRRDPAGSSPSQ